MDNLDAFIVLLIVTVVALVILFAWTGCWPESCETGSILSVNNWTLP